MESLRNVVLTQAAATQPVLNIQRSSNTQVVLLWPSNFTGFTLEANTNLNTNVWSVVAPAPVVSGTNKRCDQHYQRLAALLPLAPIALSASVRFLMLK